MDISVVICTYDRSTILRGALRSFFQCHFDDNAFELIIVDNGSSDATPSVAQEFIAQSPGHAKYIFEERPGLSNARNVGIRAARGAIIAFLDDDVYVDPNWLREVKNIFAEHPEAMCMGGKSIPLFDAGKPDWISDDLMPVYGYRNFGDCVKFLTYPRYPFGLNMAFRTAVFEKVGLFDPRLGRKKYSLLSDEEIDLFHRIDQAGLKIIYAPGALVYHRIPVERTQKRWLLKRFYWEGISNVIRERTSSRFRLLKNALRDTRDVIGLLTGRNYSPKGIYRHFRNIEFEDYVRCYHMAGRIRQSLVEIFTFRK